MSDDFDIRKLDEIEPQLHPATPIEQAVDNKVQVRVAVVNTGGMVKVIFSEPIPYMNMTKSDAKQFAASIIKAALK